jgi:hypothetical protein
MVQIRANFFVELCDNFDFRMERQWMQGHAADQAWEVPDRYPSIADYYEPSSTLTIRAVRG